MDKSLYEPACRENQPREPNETTPAGRLGRDLVPPVRGDRSSTARLPSLARRAAVIASLALAACGGGGDHATPPPSLTGISPASCPVGGGTTVALTGTGFRAGAAVAFGGAAGTAVGVASANSITATCPSSAAGPVSVVVTNADGQSAALTGAFTYVAPPVLVSLHPGSGSTGGGDQVDLAGTGFDVGTFPRITFGGMPVLATGGATSTSITVITPPHGEGAVDVTVTNGDGQAATLASAFTYRAPDPDAPTVSSVVNDATGRPSGSVAGGEAVTITGTNFAAGATVLFGAAAATDVAFVSTTTLTATTPLAQPAGTVDVTVALPGTGLGGTILGGFTFLAPGVPGEGWLIATRFDGPRRDINVFPAGAAGGVPVQTVAGGTVVGAIEGVGIAYGRNPGPLGFTEVGYFRTGDAQRIVLGAQADHGYAFVTDSTSATPFLAGGRLMVADMTGAGAASLLSFAEDGTDPRTLTTGACTGIFGARMRPAGIAFSCDPEAVYFSDGVAPAVFLGANAARSLPLEIATVDSLPYVILMSGSRLVTMPADGSNTVRFLSPEPSGIDTFLGMADSTVLVATAVTDTNHAAYTVSADASSQKARRIGGAGPTVSGSPSVTPDHRHFLAIYRNDVGTQSRAFLVPADPDDDVLIGLPTFSGTASALDAAQFADGTVLVKLAGLGYWAVSANGNAGPVLDPSTADIHTVDVGRYAVFQGSTAPFPMKAIRQDSTVSFFLTAAGDDTASPVVSPRGLIFFLDGNGFTWVAAPELSFRTLVDAVPSDSLLLGGGDATREFLAVRHVAGDRATFVVHTDTGRAEKVLGGTTSDVGWFLP